MDTYHVKLRAEELGLDGDQVAHDCMAIAGPDISDSLFLFVCLRNVTKKLRELEKKDQV